ncbi:MAG: DUF2851 family protein [Chitinophagaceae bacterium]
MTEQLLQFIWRFQYFNRNELSAVTGEKIMVVHPGMLNRDQGPDFANAMIHINGIRWVGNVELHLRTSDWRKHQHQDDRNYGNVVLHVVWKHDSMVNDIPVLELHDRIPGLLFSKYEQLMRNQAYIPCNGNTSHLTALGWLSWKDRLLFERLERKASLIRSFNRANGNDWETTCWWMLARNFGYKVNADAFETMARSVDKRIIARQKNNIIRLEALLLGQAGLLGPPATDQYSQHLAAEYHLLSLKYGLTAIPVQVNFLRMRPRNFPSLRLAQLAMILHRFDNLQVRLLDTAVLRDMKYLLQVKASDYWDNHYRPGIRSAGASGKLGSFMAGNIIINTVVPLLFEYSTATGDERYGQRAIGWLQQLSRENNSLTDTLETFGFGQENAFDSQAVIELKSQYCDQRRCLDCAVGYSILNPRHPNL